MKNYLYVLDELDLFPSAKELFPFKMYENHGSMIADFNRPSFKSNSYLKDFQEACRSPEWKAAGIVWEKYRRKVNFNFDGLRKLIVYITEWSKQRELDGKKINQDILVQECSAEFKRWNK
jgi:hypothetical protein